jgi:cytochrome P450
MTLTDLSDLHLFPMRRTCPFEPPAEYEILREEQPVAKVALPTGQTAWLVSRYEDVRTVLAEPRVSPNRALPGFPMTARIPPETLRRLNMSLLGMDPPQHTELRHKVINEFTLRRMRALRPRIQRHVDDHIDAMLEHGGPLDLVRALSLPVPSLTICELLGVPEGDQEFFQTRTALMVDREAHLADRVEANTEIMRYFDELVTAKAREPGDDLLGRVLRRHGDSLAHETLVGLARLVVIAGHETTANMISLSVVGLLDNPDQLAALLANPKLAPRAVEELLRYFSVSDVVTTRVALDDFEVGGVRIRKGDGLIAPSAAANWDGSVFADPAVLDISRDTHRHVAFGYGIHQCLGQNLARVELEVVLGTLFRRIPGLRLTVGVNDLRFKHDAEAYGVFELPVTW